MPPTRTRQRRHRDTPNNGSEVSHAGEASPIEPENNSDASSDVTTNLDDLPLVIAADADPKLMERLRLARALQPRQRIAAEAYVENNHNQKESLRAAGYSTKLHHTSWGRLMQLPHFRAYVEYLEALKLTQPDGTWCLEKLVSIVNDPKAPAAARVSAIERIGRMKQVKGLCEPEQEKGGANLTIPVKVFVGIDPEKM
jgi:hypothetical protein